jgi:peptide deformylase
VPLTLLINPELTPIGEGRSLGWEGCLSVPGLRGQVERFNRLRYCGWTPEGEWFERSVEGFHARVVQHECDHLDGVLFPDRLHTPQAFGFIPELEQSGMIPMVPS